MTVQNNSAELLKLTAEIVAAHVSNNTMSAAELPQLISQVHTSLSDTGRATSTEERPAPAVSVKKSGDARLHRVSGRRQKTENAEAPPKDILRPHPCAISRAVGFGRGLSNGCTKLCQAPKARWPKRSALASVGVPVNRIAGDGQSGKFRRQVAD